eukprot:scaffold6395_cov54-Phaeocystis_antarctica.AAC.2
MSRDAFPSRELSLSGSSRSPLGRPIKGNQNCHHRPDETYQAILRSRWPPPPLSDPPRLPPVAADIASAGSEAGVKLVWVRLWTLVLVLHGAGAGAAAAEAAGAAAPAAGAAAPAAGAAAAEAAGAAAPAAPAAGDAAPAAGAAAPAAGAAASAAGAAASAAGAASPAAAPAGAASGAAGAAAAGLDNARRRCAEMQLR